MFLCATLGGLIQGFALYDPGVEFMSSLTLVAPFRALYAVGALAILVSTIFFAALVAQNILSKRPVAQRRVPLTTREVASL